MPAAAVVLEAALLDATETVFAAPLGPIVADRALNEVLGFVPVVPAEFVVFSALTPGRATAPSLDTLAAAGAPLLPTPDGGRMPLTPDRTAALLSFAAPPSAPTLRLANLAVAWVSGAIDARPRPGLAGAEGSLSTMRASIPFTRSSSVAAIWRYAPEETRRFEVAESGRVDERTEAEEVGRTYATDTGLSCTDADEPGLSG